jgi:hypothetical protein
MSTPFRLWRSAAISLSRLDPVERLDPELVERFDPRLHDRLKARATRRVSVAIRARTGRDRT